MRPGNSASGARLAFVARTRMRIAGSSGFRMDRQHRHRSETRSQRSPARRASPSARQIRLSVPRGRSSRAAVLIQAASVAVAAAWASRRERSGDARCRAGSLNGGFIRTRCDRFRPQPGRGERARRRRNCRGTTARTRVSQSDCVARSRAASAASCGSISTSVTRAPSTRARQREAGGADARRRNPRPAHPRGPGMPPPAGLHHGRSDGRAPAAGAAACRPARHRR